MIISGGWDNMIKFWCCNTHQEILNIDTFYVVKSVAISPDGQTLVSGGCDGNIKLWNLPTGELRQVLAVQEASFAGNGVTSVAISPNGELIAGATDESKNITLWSLATGELLQTFSGHLAGVSSVIFSPDGQRLISGSYDKTARVWYL
jgi:WD40 repeat protein